jgi:hypothetical protein
MSPVAPGVAKRESPAIKGVRIIDSIRILVAAVMGLAALAAQAQAPVADPSPDTRWRVGIQPGAVTENAVTDPVLQVSLGYRLDRNWSVEALGVVNILFMRTGGQPGPYEFEDAFGMRVLGTLPLGRSWDLVGGVGIVQLYEDTGVIDGSGRHRTDAIASLSAMYRRSRHWSMGIEASSFVRTHSTNLGLRGEIHF